MDTVFETAFLAGKVLKQSLAVFQGPPIAGAPTLKRLFLSQGELAQFHDSETGIKYLAFIELRPGAVRGNHYHKLKEERLYIIKGEALLTVEDIASAGRASVPLQAGDLAIIQTGVAHAFKTLQAGEAIEFSEARFNAADIFPFSLEKAE